MPALDPAAFQKQLQAGKLGRVYVLYGDDVRRIERLVDAIEATVDPADRPFAVERVYAGEAGGSPVDIVASVSVLPMLGDHRIVTVLRAERFLKPARAKAAESDDASDADDDAPGAVDTSALEAYLERPSPAGVLVLVASGIDKGRRLTKRLFEKAHTVECKGLPDQSAPDRDQIRHEKLQEIQREAQMGGRSLDAATAQLLLNRAGGDISKLRDDLARLLLYTEGQSTITRADVEDVVSVHLEVNPWALVNAIGNGDAAGALREVALRLDGGENPHALLGHLRWWVSQRLAPAAPDRVKPALEALFRTDLALKSSGGDERMLFERLVVELTGRPVPRAPWGGGRR